jgi:D-lactate dehydrogenase
MSLIKELSKLFPDERIKLRLTDLYAYSCDAGFYSFVPKAVVFPASEEEIAKLFAISKKYKIPVTFRAAGTSLSGQSVTDGILADISKYWQQIDCGKDGKKIIVQPGITGGKVNHYLKKFGRKIGPDPASVNAAMMGGILSNNSSGMCCGVKNNSYHTLHSIRFILPDGICFDTSINNDYQKFETKQTTLFNGIKQLKNRIQANHELVQKIRAKYLIKNTVGYSLNAFLDFEDPLDILAHLLIGAEGTLAFISKAMLNTIPDKPFKITGLLCFSNSKEACNAILPLKDSGAEALELMDRAAIRAIENLEGAPDFFKSLPSSATCILCEYQAGSEESLAGIFNDAKKILVSLPVIKPVDFTSNEKIRSQYWKLRKGLYPSVAAVRAQGSSVMLEDIAVPLEVLADAIEGLQKLFLQFNYHDAIVFGHAKDGNLHFLISQPINTKEEVDVFGAFSDELAKLVIHQYNGSLKAEHGTGRQIAPYVKDEWGEEAHAIMVQLKNLVDPDNILNPGVIINNDEKCHLKNLKKLPVVEEEVDKCVECGYCEQRCPSRNYTLTPRQRIVLRRTLSSLKQSGEKRKYRTILKEYKFSGIDTCAVDGLCAVDCPVAINTGDLIKRLRRENHSWITNFISLQVSKHFGATEFILKSVLRFGHFSNAIFGKNFLTQLTALTRKVAPGIPQWNLQIGKPFKIKRNTEARPEVVYFVTCINRLMGHDKEKKEGIADVIYRLSASANVRLYIPEDSKGYCCGQVFSSKGFADAYKLTANKIIEQLWKWTEQGALPVLIDISSCTFILQNCKPFLTEGNQKRFECLTILDSIDYAADWLLPKLSITQKKKKVGFHPVCSLTKMNLHNKLQKIGESTAHQSIIPFSTGCCGMAGDRGFFFPGLINAANKELANELSGSGYDGYYSSSKTCEMALSLSTGNNYKSIFYLLDDVTKTEKTDVLNNLNKSHA